MGRGLGFGRTNGLGPVAWLYNFRKYILLSMNRVSL
jgi:hypothetical protein